MPKLNKLIISYHTATTLFDLFNLMINWKNGKAANASFKFFEAENKRSRFQSILIITSYLSNQHMHFFVTLK